MRVWMTSIAVLKADCNRCGKGRPGEMSLIQMTSDLFYSNGSVLRGSEARQAGVVRNRSLI